MAVFKVIHLTLTLIVILALPLFFLLYAFFKAYRSIIAYIAKAMDPKLGEIVSPMNTNLAAHHLRGKPAIMCCTLHIGGQVRREDVIQKLEKTVLNARTPSGNLLYPELRQRIVSKLGYAFWKNVDNFRVADHVTYFGPSESQPPFTKSEFREARIRLTKEPFHPLRSPWEVLVVQNFSDEDHPEVRSALIFRLDHTFFDGFRIFNTFGRMTDKGSVVLAAGCQLSKKSVWWQRILKPVAYSFLIPYECVAQFLNRDRNELIKIFRRDFKSVTNSAECLPLKLEEMKAVKNHFGVSLIALQSTLVLGAALKFLRRRECLPPSVNMIFPIPAGNRQDKLENHFSGGCISVSTDHPQRTHLLYEVHSKFMELRQEFGGGQAAAGLLLQKFSGHLPCRLIPNVDSTPIGYTVLNNCFPGPVEKSHIFGFPILNGSFSVAKQRICPIGAMSISYSGTFRFMFTGDTSIFPEQKDIQRLADGVPEEFAELLREMKMSQVETIKN